MFVGCALNLNGFCMCEHVLFEDLKVYTVLRIKMEILKCDNYLRKDLFKTGSEAVYVKKAAHG